MRNRSIVILAAGACVAWGATGCRSGHDTVPYAATFPGGVAQSEVLDIQVIREGTRIALTNTTARSFGPATLWINRRFSRPIDGLAVGQSLDLALSEFRDEYSEPFRAGGFWASVAADRIVQAQLLLKDGTGKSHLLGLVVVGQE